ncbi:MAG: response regulator [Candidatus Bipolaricaulia bacterium]
MKMKVLVVDDESEILNLLKRFLVTRDREVLTATNGPEALTLFANEQPDLVILDVVMPGIIDGWEVLAKIRESSQVPIIMLTGQDTPTDTAKGLLSGADDYIAKPFDLGELEARITAVMRRYQGPTQPKVLQVGDLTIDDNVKEVQRCGRTIRLSPKEYELLKLLASDPSRVFSHREIIQEVWHNKHLISSSDVNKYIYLLRAKLEENPKTPQLILTVRGFGYKLAA